MVKDNRNMRIPSDSEKHLRVISSKGSTPHEDRESSSVGSDSGGKVAKRERFIAVDRRIFSYDLTAAEVLVFAYVDQFQGAKVCFATNETIAKDLNLCIRQVQRCLKKLKSKKLIRAFYEGKKRLLKTYLNTR
jgi:hypothetical protein